MKVLSLLLAMAILLIGVVLSLAVFYNIAFEGFPPIIGVGMMFVFLVAASIGAELVND